MWHFGNVAMSTIKNKIHNRRNDNKIGKSGERGNPFCDTNLMAGWSLYRRQWLNYIIVRNSRLENMITEAQNMENDSD
jgi:hypothetical protein